MATFHMSGLASGQDTQAIIDAMIKAKSTPLTTMEEEQTKIESDLTAWSDLNTLMTNLTDSLDTLRTWETWSQMAATSSDESQLTATASSSASVATYKISITQLAQAHSISSSSASDLKSDATSTTDLVAGGILTAGNEFTIGGQTITIGSTESLSTLRTKINTAASSMDENNRVYASILDNRLVLTRSKTGDTDITLSDSTGTPLQALKILNASGGCANEFVVSQDAKFTVNGAEVTRSTNTNLTDVVENVTLNLLDKTLSDITLTVTRDIETPKNAILDFIEKYNAAATAMDDYGQINVSGNNPKGATLDTSTLGELFNDSLLGMIKNNIRAYATEAKPFLELYKGYKNSSTIQVIDPTYTYKGQTGTLDSLDDIGIWTTGETNQLTLTDEDKLDYVLANNFDQVQQLFRGVYTTADGYENGLAADFYRYSDNVSTSLTGDIARRTTTLQDKYDTLGTNMTELQKELTDYEQTLWEQFTTMEDTIASLQSSLTSLTSQLTTSSS
jgi:flagellar hook-associated protein 2